MKAFGLLLLCCLSCGQIMAQENALFHDPLNTELLENYNKEIRENPTKYRRRWQRASILLRHGEYSAPVQEDIDSLLAQPKWRVLGERLQPIKLYLEGKSEEAATLIRKNIKENGHSIQEQTRLLATIELAKKDTAAAVAAFQSGWDLYGDENVYVDLLNAYRGWKTPPKETLQKGLERFPNSPGTVQTIYEAYFTSGTPDDMKQCLVISGKAVHVLWPMSVDWKVRHAKALVVSGESDSAESVLQQALELMDSDPRWQSNADNVPAIRKDVFTLLEKIRSK